VWDGGLGVEYGEGRVVVDSLVWREYRCFERKEDDALSTEKHWVPGVLLSAFVFRRSGRTGVSALGAYGVGVMAFGRSGRTGV